MSLWCHCLKGIRRSLQGRFHNTNKGNGKDVEKHGLFDYSAEIYLRRSAAERAGRAGRRLTGGGGPGGHGEDKGGDLGLSRPARALAPPGGRGAPLRAQRHRPPRQDGRPPPPTPSPDPTQARPPSRHRGPRRLRRPAGRLRPLQQLPRRLSSKCHLRGKKNSHRGQARVRSPALIIARNVKFISSGRPCSPRAGRCPHGHEGPPQHRPPQGSRRPGLTGRFLPAGC